MISLAVKYRPQKFSDVCSQESIIKILERQLELKQFKNAYLFCGASGCGKTTIARIFANEINNYIGVPIEIDGASNNGVDNIKTIIKSANERSLSGQYKIYIIDECHALTSQAWQAFLKCLEEPPEYTIFIFCTTDPQKIPMTILNRVMRFNFARISQDLINSRLIYICKQEGFTNYIDGCNFISRNAMGCMRDAISMLDKSASYNTDLSEKNVETALGKSSYTIMLDLLNSIILGDPGFKLNIIDHIFNSGFDLSIFISQFLSFCIDINKYVLFKDISKTSLPASVEPELEYFINIPNVLNYYQTIINGILDCKNAIKNDNDIKSTIIVYLFNLPKVL